MTTKEKQVVDSKKSTDGFLDQHMTVFSVLSENAAQMAELQKSLIGFATDCVANMMNSAMAMQTEIARLSFDAMLHGDPVAMMSLGQRAARIGFGEGMDCATRNLQTAQSFGAHFLDAVATPPGAKSGTP